MVRNVTFADIFDTAAPAAGACPAGYRAVKHSYGEECLALKAGKEMWAAALETRRWVLECRPSLPPPARSAVAWFGCWVLVVVPALPHPLMPPPTRTRTPPHTHTHTHTATLPTWAPPPSGPSGRASPTTPSAGSCTPP